MNLFGINIFTEELLFRGSHLYTTSDFSEELQSYFFRRGTSDSYFLYRSNFIEKQYFGASIFSGKATLSERLLFQKSYFFIVVSFSEEVLSQNILF